VDIRWLLMDARYGCCVRDDSVTLPLIRMSAYAFAGSSNPPLGVVRVIRASLVQCTHPFLDTERILDAGQSVSSIAANTAAAETSAGTASKAAATNPYKTAVGNSHKTSAATALEAAAAETRKAAATNTSKTTAATTTETASAAATETWFRRSAAAAAVRRSRSTPVDVRGCFGCGFALLSP
jgi:hypothetical protein